MLNFLIWILIIAALIMIFGADRLPAWRQTAIEKYRLLREKLKPVAAKAAEKIKEISHKPDSEK